MQGKGAPLPLQPIPKSNHNTKTKTKNNNKIKVVYTENLTDPFKVGPAEPRTIPLDEVCTCAANDVGHLEPWPTHLLLLRRPAFLEHQRVQRTGRGMQVPLREVEIASSFFQIVMA